MRRAQQVSTPSVLNQEAQGATRLHSGARHARRCVDAKAEGNLHDAPEAYVKDVSLTGRTYLMLHASRWGARTKAGPKAQGEDITDSRAAATIKEGLHECNAPYDPKWKRPGCHGT